MNEEKEGKTPVVVAFNLREVARVFGISTLIAAAPLIAIGVQTHGWWVKWHDDRYVKRGETITLAQADKVEQQLKEVSAQANETAAKLDRLMLNQARQDMWTAQDRLGVLRQVGAGWEEIREAEKRLQLTTDYYECLKKIDFDTVYPEAAAKQCERFLGG